MGQRTKDQLSLTQRRVLSGNEAHLFSAQPYGRAALVVCGGKRQRKVRVPMNECAKLATSISAGPEHSDWDFIHKECIIMHTARVNAHPENI